MIVKRYNISYRPEWGMKYTWVHPS